MKYRRVASLKNAADLRDYLVQIEVNLGFDERMASGPDAPLAQSYRLRSGFTIGNRFCILPMEGWDGTTDGRPS